MNNDGVMFVPVIQGTNEGDHTWQVNLKIPARNDAKTKRVDEYHRTRGRTSVTLTFERPVHRKRQPGGTVSGGGTNPFGGNPIGGGGFGGSGSGTVNGGSNPPVPGSTPSPTPTPTGGTAGGGSAPTKLTSPPPIPTVRFPWYAWVLLPVAILCLAAVRSVLFEQVRSGVRPGGVVSSIRQRNGTAGRAPRGAVAALLARARKEKGDSDEKPPES